LKTLKARRYAKNNLKRCQKLEAKLKVLQKRSTICVQSISNESMEAIADNFAISKMESEANRIHEEMFNSTSPEWENDFSTDFINILEPSLAVSTLGYNLDYIESLDYLTKDPKTKIAGVINTIEKKIWISNAFEGYEKRFTLAHEIGHAVMHKGMDMHRDRPVDGSSRSKAKRDFREYEADQFAVYFLMPEDYLRSRFKQLFLTDSFRITDDVLSVLDKKVSQEVQATQNIRELTRIIAEVRLFNSQSFNPLTKQFGVSIEAMAIRLEELELVKFIKD
jgi:Zn-dependent peptidase ImmA (M78 family)